MTSGILILGKNKEIASRFHEENASEVIKKMYYARVNGNFEWEELKLDKPLLCLSHK
jgi:23S rRNA-/tRNA-specific pseudouridylate synthase